MLQGAGAGLAEARERAGEPRPFDSGPGKLAKESTIKTTIRVLAMEAIRLVIGEDYFFQIQS